MAQDLREAIGGGHDGPNPRNLMEFINRVPQNAVLTVEKNRFGRDGAVLQFRTRFDQGRYEPEGTEVKEQLIDERVFRE